MGIICIVVIISIAYMVYLKHLVNIYMHIL